MMVLFPFCEFVIPVLLSEHLWNTTLLDSVCNREQYLKSFQMSLNSAILKKKFFLISNKLIIRIFIPNKTYLL